MAADDYAVVGGISRYPALGDLSGPEFDAEDFCSWLLSQSGGNVPSANIAKVLSSNFPLPANSLQAEPTTVHLDRAFDQLYTQAEAGGGRAGRRLYIYLAGHGFAPNLEDAALLMANAAKGRTGYHIPGRPYANWFRSARFFDEIVLIMDCCRENYQRAPLHLPPYEPINSDPPARHLYAFATEWSRTARERLWPQINQVRGLFTMAVLAGLRGGAKSDGAGKITSEALEAFVFNFLQANDDSIERQEPNFEYNKMKQVVFDWTLPTSFRLRVTPPGSNAGTPVELRDGALQSVPGMKTDANTWEWVLPPGLYNVRVSGSPDQVVELIGEGRTVDVQL